MCLDLPVQNCLESVALLVNCRKKSLLSYKSCKKNVSVKGLDPAGPLFESQHPKARLDSTDASFVDVIHSNGENLILGGLGKF